MQETLDVVDAWYGLASRGEWQRVPEVAGPTYVRHEQTGTQAVTSEEYSDEIRQSVERRGVLRWDYAAFAEGDMAFVTWVARGGPDRVMSGVQAYRVADGKLVETWLSAIAPVEWGLRVVGEGDPEANKRLLRRWYEEMYEQRRFEELAPQLCGPTFTRHEAQGSFDVSAAAHGQRLADAIAARDAREDRTPLIADYRAFSAGDRVGVIATGSRSGPYVQTWRVENGKFVESWWAGFAQASWT